MPYEPDWDSPNATDPTQLIQHTDPLIYSSTPRQRVCKRTIPSQSMTDLYYAYVFYNLSSLLYVLNAEELPVPLLT